MAKVVDCDVTTAARGATFYGRMETVGGASRMQMRFQLLERLGRAEDWQRVDVPELRGWRISQAGVKRFGWKQTVDGLRTGAAYRARVHYRWLGASGEVLATSVRETPVCRGPLPNIALTDLTARPGPATDTSVYRVTVENTGRIPADEVEVSVSVDRAVLDTITLRRLAAGEMRTVSFNGPACRRAVRVRTDPGNSIGETIEDDNSQLFSCP